MSSQIPINLNCISRLNAEVLAEWNEVHYHLMQLFIVVSGMPTSRAMAVFTSLTSESDQRQITRAATKDALAASSDLKRAIVVILDELDGRLSVEKAKVQHGNWNADPGSAVPEFRSSAQLVIDAQELCQALTTCAIDLSTYCDRARSHMKLGQEDDRRLSWLRSQEKPTAGGVKGPFI